MLFHACDTSGAERIEESDERILEMLRNLLAHRRDNLLLFDFPPALGDRRAQKIRDDVSRLHAVTNPGRMTEKESSARRPADF